MTSVTQVAFPKVGPGAKRSGEGSLDVSGVLRGGGVKKTYCLHL